MTMVCSLTAEEIEQALTLARVFKNRFAAVARDLLDAAREHEVEEHVARLSITTECLLLAAYMYTGDRESFLQCANQAMADAEVSRPEVGLQ